MKAYRILSSLFVQVNCVNFGWLALNFLFLVTILTQEIVNGLNKPTFRLLSLSKQATTQETLVLLRPSIERKNILLEPFNNHLALL